MIPWLLLLLTVGFACITYDSFRWTKRVPFSAIATLWKGGLSHLNLGERAEMQRRYSSTLSGMGQIGWLFLATTIALAIYTVRAFLS